MEILGDQIKKMKLPIDFFYKFFKDSCANIEELIIDSILKKKQLQDIVRALSSVI